MFLGSTRGYGTEAKSTPPTGRPGAQALLLDAYMASLYELRLALLMGGAGFSFCFSTTAFGLDEPATVTKEQWRQLLQQNQALEQELRQQASLIEVLNLKINQLETNRATQDRVVESPPGEATRDETPATRTGVSLSSGSASRVILSGEGGTGFFNTGREGQYPQGQFRLDETRLFLDASIWGDVYFFGQLDLATPEEPDVQARLGEAYLDFENVSRLWGQDRTLNVRAGRMFIPFGEEYMSRYAIDNPLISRSLADIWGVNAGLELYGQAGRFSYVVAVQNGGVSDTKDFDNDKSVAGRVGYDPAPWLHVSLSGARTGNLTVQGDQWSALWFGNGFFRSLGSPQTATFHVELCEGDVTIRLPQSQIRAFGGYARYEDNDPTADNGRNIFYYAVEGVRDLTGKFYVGFRLSQIFAHDGFPVVGYGNFPDYFFDTLTKELWRLSLGAGCRLNRDLVLKAEYSFERGKELDGENRDHEDFFGLEAAFAF